MKKIFVLSIAAIVLQTVALAHGDDKKCANGKTCCKKEAKGKTCCKKEAKTSVAKKS